MKYILIIFLQFTLTSNVHSQDVWSKTWDAGNTGMTNRIKSSHLINDTLYYVTFNVCNYNGETWNECNTIGMMDMYGSIMKEKTYHDLSIIEQGRIPWIVENDKLIFIDGKGSWEIPTIDVKQYNRFTLDSIRTHTFTLSDNIDFNFGTSLISFGEFYVGAGLYRISDADIWPDFLVCISKESMEIDTIIEYPLQKQSIVPQFLFVDPDSLLTVYWSGIAVSDDNSTNGGRGFMKVDKNLNIVSNYIDTIDTDTQHQYPHAAYQLSNGNMVYKQQYEGEEQIFPISWSSDYEIINIDKTGELLWRFNNPGWSPYGFGEKEITHITETSEGDILACGYTRWHSNWITAYKYNVLEDIFPPPPDIDSIGLYYAPYLLKLDGETGELLWQYSIIELDEYGNNLPYIMRQIHELSDGSLIGTGWSRIFDENGVATKDNSWVIRLPADGCISSDGMECGFENYVPTSTSDPILIDMSVEKPFIFYPNPSNGEYNVLDQRKRKEKINFVVTDINGKVVKTDHDVFLERLDLTDLRSNIFYISIFDSKGNAIQAETLVKDNR